MQSDSLLCQIPGENPPQPIFEQTVRLNGSGVSYACSNPNHFPEHTDPHVKISIPLANSSFHATWQTATGQRKQQHVQAGHVSILPANLPHETLLESKQEMIVINFEPILLEQIADELGNQKIEIVEKWAAQDPLVRQLGIDLRGEFQLRVPRLLYIESVIHVLANHLIKHYSTTCIPFEDASAKLPIQKLEHIIAYIDDQLEQNVTLSELANVVQMSQYRFARAFKQSTGLSPHQYLLSQRIERAKKLLSETQLSIADISYQLGFASQSHFTATFRRLTTVTPSVYRTTIGASF
ncbi:transcriptional regulator, AraC family [Gloeocapsa sp. PCC 7428]|uniref:AraC family transcriptional regulator n=1 Tax=Gloeocapsa sp. PCC 7428 TaxID=1173026 RepID=UPI0002A5C625|nr:AraC family transcriptional regulator [Gloeocapsa sp. PCC 7428]AFZ32510.1 transcriptional regulator, AraC family [Gloeocapsa sp. PCC 7428]